MNVSAHSAGAYTATLYVMVTIVKRGWECMPHPHPHGVIFPSRWNVRQKATVASLCVLCGLSRLAVVWGVRFGEEDAELSGQLVEKQALEQGVVLPDS